MQVETSPRVVTVGEAMLQVTPSPIGRLAEATTAALSVAGAESTVASYLSLLGHHAIWLSAVGDDPIGERIVSDIRAAGVYTSLVSRDPFAPSGVYFKDPSEAGRTVVHYYRSGSAASRLSPASIADFAFFRDDLVHLSGITPALSTSCRNLVDAVIREAHAAHATVSFDVNYRSGLWSIEEAAETLALLANRADIVFVGLDEAEELWQTSSPEAVRQVLPGPMTVVVKNGSVDATVFDGPVRVVAPARAIDIVEPVGAGDAFAAGYLHGVLVGAELATCLRYGHALAASSLRAPGDIGAIPPEIPPHGRNRYDSTQP